MEEKIQILYEAGMISKEEFDTWNKIKNIIEENEGFSSISLRKLTIEIFQNIKKKLETTTEKELSNDEAMKMILDIVKKEIEK